MAVSGVRRSWEMLVMAACSWVCSGGSVPAGNSHFPLSGIFSGNSNRNCIGGGNTPDGSWSRMDLDGRKKEEKNRS